MDDQTDTLHCHQSPSASVETNTYVHLSQGCLITDPTFKSCYRNTTLLKNFIWSVGKQQ